MGSDLQTEGRIGLAIAELGDAELSRRCGEARHVGGGIAEKGRLVEAVRRLHRPEEIRRQEGHRDVAIEKLEGFGGG